MASNFGYGNCQKKLGGFPICYVTKPSNCSDLVNSTSIPGEMWSKEACSIEGNILSIWGMRS